MRILLISHEASRTGAPRVAALIARCLVAQGHDVRITSRTRGPLLADFSAEAPTRVEFLSRARRRLRELPIPRWLPRSIDSLVVFFTVLAHRPDLVYVNSTAAAAYVRPARFLRRRVLLHAHESGPVARQFLAEVGALSHLADVDLVACSPSVLRELAGVCSRPIDSIEMIPSVPDDVRVLSLADEDIGSPKSDVDGEALIVGCCGTVEPRKGYDLWIAAAKEVRRLLPDVNVRFLWIGDLADGVVPDTNGSIEFTGPRPNPYPMMRSFDIATLPSRDDPFPLVVLESMILGKPVVAFAVGAVADQIGDAGILIAPRDTLGFAQALAELLVNEDRRRSLGKAARERAKVHYSTAAFAGSLATLIANPRAQPMSAIR